MLVSKGKALLGIGGGITILGFGLSLRNNDYDLNSFGLIRLGRAGVTAARVAQHYRTKLYSSDLDKNSEEYQKLKSEVHTTAAMMLLNLCNTNKGVYIKVGQHIGTLDYLVPQEYVKIMKVLHCHAPESSLKSVYNVLREDLKQEPSDVFEYFEEKPLGTASLAQVHRAKLKKDGSLVAVKVQHALVLKNSKADLQAMELLVKIMSYLFEEFRFDWLVNETKLNLPKELDFVHEANNSEKVKEIMKKYEWLKIPKINWDLTTHRVLTMEFADGAQITDLSYIDENNVNKVDLSTKLGELYSNMIFKYGFVHSDPHPGNILIKQNSENKLDIILLDHGLYANLTEEFRWNYSKFWMSILNRDMTGMKTTSEKLGIGELYPIFVCMVTGRTWDAVTGGIDKIKYSETEKEQFISTVPLLLTKIGEVLQSVNREMLLILKTNDLLRGIEHSLNLHKRQPSFLVMSKCCIENIYEERKRQCRNSMTRFYTSLCKQWTLLKLNIYYFYINLRIKLYI